MDFYIHSPEQTAKAAAVQLAIRFGMKTDQPLKISENVGSNGNPSLEQLKDLEGRNWLTSLKIFHGDKSIELEECIISINQEKNIVTTALQGRNGTIKEYISDGDYQINISAAVSNYRAKENNYEASFAYPEEKVGDLEKLLKLPETLSLHSDFLKLFDIEAGVVKSYSMEQETHSNRQSFQITMLSDKPYEIKLKEDA